MPYGRLPGGQHHALLATLAVAATACTDDGSGANGKPDAGPTRARTTRTDTDTNSGGSLADRLREHGIDVDDWADGGWKDWDRDKWLSEAEDLVNPVIEDLWGPERMRSADEGDSDPVPAPVGATPEQTPYHEYAAPAGKVFFDSPVGSMVCSGTVVKDVNHPGESNLVWTAGHCVHAGGSGGWFRDMAFVPAYNDFDRSASEPVGATEQEIAPYGQWWADWAVTADEWIAGGAGAAYDYAVLHEQGPRTLAPHPASQIAQQRCPGRPQGPAST